jgi:DNA-binding transcriptional LysR family regulator
MDDIDRIERRLKLHDLRILMAVVAAGSMHKAAERLAISQSAISRAVADLEETVDARLLDRSPLGIEPTESGRALIKRGVAMFDELRQAVGDIKFLSDPSAGELRIGCSEVMAAGPVSAVVKELTEHHSRRVFHVLTGATVTLYRALTERRIDLVIGRVAGAVPNEHEDAGGLFEDTVVVAAGPQSRWICNGNVELDDVVNEPWALPPFDTEMGAIVLEAFQARGLPPPQATVVAGSTHMRHDLAASGRFLTVVPEFALRLPGTFAALRQVPVELPNARRMLRIITAKNRSLSPLAALFVDSLRTNLLALTTDAA